MTSLTKILRIHSEFNGYQVWARSLALPPGAPVGRGASRANDAVRDLLEKLLTSKTWFPHVSRLLREALREPGECQCALAYRFDGDTVVVTASDDCGAREVVINLKGGEK